MSTIIHHVNFKSSKALDSFIQEKTAHLLELHQEILSTEFHLSTLKNKFKCTLLLVVKGKNIVVNRTTDDMHYSVLKTIDVAKKMIVKKKSIHLDSRQKKTKI